MQAAPNIIPFKRRPQINRGYLQLYRVGEVNHCPGCGGQAWHVGRRYSECAGCGTALAIAGEGK